MIIRIYLLFAFYFAFLGIVSLAKAVVPVPTPSTQDEYIVKLSENKQSNYFFNFFSEKGNSNRIIKSHLKGINAYTIKVNKEDLKLLKSKVEFKYVEPNGTVQAMTTIPSQQWALTSNYGVQAEKAWAITKGAADVVVAVIDTGIDYNHEALKNNMWVNKGEIPGNEIDDDENGYVDDIYGYDFANSDSDPLDDNMHGTHCAGIIAANHPKLYGIAPNVKVMAIKFLTRWGGGTLEGGIQGIEYAVNNGAKVLSNSWGTTMYNEALGDAVKYAESKGVIFIAAAGNSYGDNDERPTYPATYDVENVVAVGALNPEGGKAYFSNYGKETVDLFAPGLDIYSSVIGNNYKELSGTSMATPYVSGAAALILSKYPGSSYSEVKERLMKGVQKLDVLEEISVTGGTLDAYKSLL